MRQSKGVVKKYSREYTRTLKSGQRKKYKTEQVQITIPKQDNVFDDKEDVLIIPYSENPFEGYEKDLADLKDKYENLQDENNKLKERIASFEIQSIENQEEDTVESNNLEETQNQEMDNNGSSDFKNDYKDDIIFNLQEEYIDLTKRYEELQRELFLLKNDQVSNEYLIKRLKNFILNFD